MTIPIRSYAEVSYGDTLTAPTLWTRPGFDRSHLFRCTPVPGVTHGRHPVGTWLRHPNTSGAHRAAAGALHLDREDGVRPTNQVARLFVLPTAWDDLPRCGGRPSRSWKRHRRTQYKPNQC